MDVIYYYYFLFYQKVLKEDDPHEVARWSLSASEGFFTAWITSIILARYYCYRMSTIAMFSFIIVFYIINYFVYQKTRKSYEIVKQRPQFFNSRQLSIFITILFFLMT